MRAILLAATFLAYLSGPSSAFDLVTKNGQAVCDSLLAFEELTIAIGMRDDSAILEMGNKGCHLPGPGLRMELVEAYADQTALLFRKLADNTHLGPVPDHIERLTNLAKVRLFDREGEPMVGFTMLPVSRRPDSPGDGNAEN
jgi:hypothetical protein